MQPWEVASHATCASRQEIDEYENTPLDSRSAHVLFPTPQAMHLDIFGGVDSDLNLANRECVEKQMWEIIKAQPETFLSSQRVDHPIVLVRDNFHRMFYALRVMTEKLSSHMSTIQTARGEDIVDDVVDAAGIVAAMKQQYSEAQRGKSRKPWVCTLATASDQDANGRLFAFLEVR